GGRGDRAVCDSPRIAGHASRTRRRVASRVRTDRRRRRRDRSRSGAAVDVVEAGGGVIECRCNRAVGGGEQRFVLEITEVIELRLEVYGRSRKEGSRRT